MKNEELGKIKNSEFGIQREESGAGERGCHTDLYFANAKYGVRELYGCEAMWQSRK